MRPVPHEESIEFGKGFLEICDMKIEVIELRKSYFELMADEEVVFDREAFEAVKTIVNVIKFEPEKSEELYSEYYEKYGISEERTHKMKEVAKGLDSIKNLNYTIMTLERALRDRRSDLDNAYNEGVVLGMLRRNASIEEITRKTGFSAEKVARIKDKYEVT